MKPIFAIKNLEIMRDKWKDPEYDISEQDASELLAYIAELEAEIDQLTAHDATERQTVRSVRKMDKERLQDILAKHNRWLKGAEGGERADLRGADLTGANLWRANLRDADLRNADLDYSCLPLWCGSKGMIVDCRIAAQIAAHFCALSCDDPDFLAAREAVLPFAQTSHRAMELGIKERG